MKKGKVTKSSACETSCTKNSLSLAMVRLIDKVLRGSNEEVRTQTDIISRLYGESVAKNPSIYRFLVKKVETVVNVTSDSRNEETQSTDENLINLLKAIDMCRVELTTHFLCQFLLNFITCCKSSASTTRQRHIIRLNGTNLLIKRLMLYMKGSEYCPNVDVICSILILLFARDKLFCLKARLCGLISLFQKNLLSIAKDRRISVMQVCCCSIRSVPNARIFGKNENLMSDLIKAIVDFSDAEIVVRLMEILYIIIKFKNSVIMTILESNDILNILTRQFKKYFKPRFCSSEFVDLEICLFTLASLRNLTKLRRNRERLKETGALQIFYSAISTIYNYEEYGSDFASKKYYMKVQDSLYALCMSCLPCRVFSLPSSTPSPISFPLPTTGKFNSDLPRLLEKKIDKNVLPIPTMQDDENIGSSDDDADDDERESLFTLAPVDHDEYGESLTFDHLKSISAKSSDSQKNKSSVDYSQFFMEYDHGTPSVISSTRCQNLDFTDLLKKAVKKIKSPTVFIKIAYPTMILPTDLCSFLQPMAKIDTKRDLLSKEMAYLQEQSTFNARVVYDLDSLVCSGDQLPESLKVLDNDDHNRVGIMVSEDHLLFESRFEGANLRRAIQISKWHYQLILSPDINQIKPHYQWFYFEVSNNEAHVDYMFEIVNCFKKISMFNNGMQPVLFSVTEACRGNPGWIRSGSEICYCRNTFVNSFAEKGKDPTVPKNYFSLRFTIKFIHRADVCYIAYHFPYTYSMLRATLEWYLAKINEKRLYIRYDELCTSLAGNSVFLVTVTASGSKEQLANRELILISARVHPGENNSSWIMHGIMNFLVSDKREAVELRDQFVFKLIPMLNVDGVVNGSHRCSLAGIDLNRTWNQPSPVLHPPIYHSKAIVEYMVNVLQKKPFLYVDLHGHSKRFNVFLYGNNPEESWCIEDHSLPGKSDFMSLPRLLKNSCGYFSLSSCRFNITKTKESSSRVALWREYGITRSYTMESTYCGFDAGPLKGYQINILHMLEMGAILCEACRHLQHHMPVQDDEESE